MIACHLIIGGTMQDDNTLPLIGRDISFSSIDKEVLIAKRFGQLSRVEDGKVHAFDKNMPYGFLEVEGETFEGAAMLTLTHKDDFLHVWQAFEERGIGKDEEALVIWTDSNYKNKVFSAMKATMPKIIVWICPNGAYRIMHESNYKPELSGEARFIAKAPIVEIKSEVMW